MLLHFCSYFAALALFIFLTLSLASGLLYVAEVIEEHSILAKKIGQRAIYTIISWQIILFFIDKLAFHVVATTIIAHLVYLQNFSKTWPRITLLSPIFLASCAMSIISHLVAFYYFTDHTNAFFSSSRYRNHYRSSNSSGGTSFLYSSWPWSIENSTFFGIGDIATYFGLGIWLVPFYLFLSLSANDNVLPSSNLNTTAATKDSPSKRSTYPQSHHRAPSIFKSLLSPIMALPAFRSRSQKDGLIGSPLPSPSFPPPPGPRSRSTSPIPTSSSSITSYYHQNTSTPPPPSQFSNANTLHPSVSSHRLHSSPDLLSSSTSTPPTSYLTPSNSSFGNNYYDSPSPQQRPIDISSSPSNFQRPPPKLKVNDMDTPPPLLQTSSSSPNNNNIPSTLSKRR